MTYCVLPWINITVDPDGSIKPCCVSSDTIRKQDGTPYNLGTDTIQDIFNSPDYISIREKMLIGEKVTGCNQCYMHESHGGKSQRLQYNTEFPYKFTNKVAEVNVKYFDLRLGNLCNLSCRSCSPKNSSQFAKEIKLFQNSGIHKFHNTVEEIGEWYNTDTFEENIESQLSNIKMIYFTGGEPTIIKKNYEILNSLIEKNVSKNITLKFNSNMTNFNSSFFELIDKFKRVIFLASVDGYGDMQEYLRYPSNWEQVDINIKKLIKKTNVIIVPTPVVQITNLNKITELFDYFEDFNRQLKYPKILMMPIVLENPKYLDFMYLPKDFKLDCLKKIEDFLSRCKFQTSLFHNKIGVIRNKCILDSHSIENLSLYKEYNTLLDVNRNQSLEKLNPELYSVL